MVTNTVRLGVDFGTSNTVAVLRRDNGAAMPLLFDSSPLLASGVFADADGELLTGADAERAATAHPAGFEANPKRRIDDRAVRLSERELPVAALVAAVLRRVMAEAERVGGTVPGSAVLTHPVAWSRSRLGLLSAAAWDAGITEVGFVAEPVAAAAYFATVLGRELPRGQCLVVYDLGAGTFDVSVVRHTADRAEVIATDGLADVGGLDVDAVVVAHARSVTSGKQAGWGRLDWPETPADQRAHRALWQGARAVKEQLSRHAKADLHVPLVDADVHVTRDEFERAARPLLDRTVALTLATLRTAGVRHEEIAGVFLVGGSSRIPLVASLLHRALRIAPTVIDQPELVVAIGSLHAEARPAPAAAAASTVEAAPPAAKAAPPAAKAAPPAAKAAPPAVEQATTEAASAAAVLARAAVPTVPEPVTVSTMPEPVTDPAQSEPVTAPVAAEPTPGRSAEPAGPTGEGHGRARLTRADVEPAAPEATGTEPAEHAGPPTAEPATTPATAEPAGTEAAEPEPTASGLAAAEQAPRLSAPLAAASPARAADSPAEPPPTGRRGRRRVVVLATAVAVLVVAGVIAGVVLSNRDRNTATSGTSETASPSPMPALTLTGHTGAVNTVAWSPDGKTIATSSVDHTARLWNAATGQPIATLTGHTNSVGKIVYSPDGESVVTVSGDATIRLWNAANGQPIDTYHGSAFIISTVVFSRDGGLLATGSLGENGIRLWSTATRAQVREIVTEPTVTSGLPHFVSAIAFSRDGRTVATASSNGPIRLWEVSSGNRSAEFASQPGRVHAMLSAPDGTTLLTASDGDHDVTVSVWSVPGGEQKATFRAGDANNIETYAFSPDGRLFATAGKEGDITLWDVATGQETGARIQHACKPRGIAFSPDAGTLAAACEDGVARLWPTAPSK
ncbi:Hsp70 family protein [Dactylosporangium sp. CA-139066]|uniref:Hsp70 family protein n=1 Tax=Dactylosporangium sp. CA-139066 TaxID=3239930 RepID=UPI003D9168C2